MATHPKEFISKGVKYIQMYFASRDFEYVSNWWFVLLFDLFKGGIKFNVNEGKRSMARQEELVRQKGLWSPSNPHGAAAPSPNAPHIRVGRKDHAIDFDNAGEVIAGAARRGVTLRRTVPGEPWHLEADVRELHRFYLKRVGWVVTHWKFARKAKPKPRKELKKPIVRAIKPPTKASKKITKMIAGFEGGRGKDGLFHPYRDQVGVWTIGFGHTKGVNHGSKPLTLGQAEALLQKDLNLIYARYVVAAARKYNLRLRQNEFDALLSAVYNLGPGIMDRGRSLGDAMHARNKRAMADSLLLYVFAGKQRSHGLEIRRAAERAYFLGK